MTRTETIQVLALLRSAFPNTRIDAETTVNLWYSLYCQEEFNVVKKATEIIITTLDFFPSHKQFGEALVRAKMLMAYEDKTKLLSPITEDSVNKKIQVITDWWEDDEIN